VAARYDQDSNLDLSDYRNPVPNDVYNDGNNGGWVDDGHGSWMPPPETWPAGKVWDYTVAGFVDAPVTPGPTPDPGPGPGDGGGGGTGTYSPPQSFGGMWPGMGGFAPPSRGDYGVGGGGGSNLPSYAKPPAFRAPTLEEAMQEPGYKFRLDQGQRALEQSAAARGVLNTGGTLKDLLQYGQDFASNEYGNVYNRAVNDYMTNYGSQYVDPYQFNYKQSLDSANLGNQAYQFDYSNAYNKWLSDYSMWRNQQNDDWLKLNQVYGK